MDPADLSHPQFWSDRAAPPVALINPRRAGDSAAVEAIAQKIGELDGHLLIETSGSSSEPRFVCLSRDALRVSAGVVNDHLASDSGDRWLNALPLFHVGGLGAFARAALSGASVHEFAERWDARSFRTVLDTREITLTSLVPTQVADLVANRQAAPSSLRAVLVGGGRLSPEMRSAAIDLGWPLLETYGMTEAASQIATQPLEAAYQPTTEAFPMQVLPHWQARLGDEACVQIRGESLFRGYLVPEAPVDRRFVPAIDQSLADAERWFPTRDRGELVGTALRILGRADRCVKILGELVSLDRLEDDVRRLLPEGLRGAVAIEAVSTLREGARLVAIAEKRLDPGLLREAIESYQRDHLAFERIGDVIPVERFPLSSLGKIRRAELRRLTDLR